MSQTLTAADEVDQRISAAVLGLIAQRRLTVTKIAQLVGVSRTTMYHRVNNERPWEASEIERLARVFDVSRDSLFEGRADFRDAQSSFGSEGWEFESLRVHPEAGHFRRPSQRPRRRRTDHRGPSIYLVASA